VDADMMYEISVQNIVCNQINRPIRLRA